MNKKSITVVGYNLFLILFIGLLVVGTIIIVRLWLSSNECETLQYDCSTSKVIFCTEWIKTGEKPNVISKRSISDIKSCKFDEKNKPVKIDCDFPNSIQECKVFLGLD